MCTFPVIDAAATGRNILRLRQEHGLSVREIQRFFGFEEPRVIYMWQKGQCLPSVDNLYALSALLNVPMNEILIPRITEQQQAVTACCAAFYGVFVSSRRGRDEDGALGTHLRPPASPAGREAVQPRLFGHIHSHYYDPVILPMETSGRREYMQMEGLQVAVNAARRAKRLTRSSRRSSTGAPSQ